MATLFERLERGLVEVMRNGNTYFLSESMPIGDIPEYMCLLGNVVDIKPSLERDGYYYLWVTKNGVKHA